MNEKILGGFFIILSMLLFSLQSVIARYITLNIFTALFYLYLFFTLSLTILLLIKDRSAFQIPHRLPLLLISGFILALNQIFYFFSYRLTTLSNTVLVHYTAPIFALIFAVIFLREKFDWKTIPAIMLSLVGIFVLTSNSLALSKEHLYGIVFGILSGITYGALIPITKVLVKSMKSFTLLFYQSLPPLFIYLFFAFREVPTPKDLGITALTGSIIYICAALCFLYGSRRIQAQHFGIIAYVEIIFVTLYGYFFFEEIPSAYAWIGGLLIILSGIWIIRSESKSNTDAV